MLIDIEDNILTWLGIIEREEKKQQFNELDKSRAVLSKYVARYIAILKLYDMKPFLFSNIHPDKKLLNKIKIIIGG